MAQSRPMLESQRSSGLSARLQAEQEQAALHASLHKLESTRQLEAVALQRNLPLGAAALQASRLQLQQQVPLQRRRHQDARYAELCAQHSWPWQRGPSTGGRPSQASSPISRLLGTTASSPCTLALPPGRSGRSCQWATLATPTLPTASKC